MGIIATGNTGDFEQLPAGSFIARCYKMHDIGTQTMKDGKKSRKVWIYFEILSELVRTETEDGEVIKMQDIRMNDGRPFSIQQQYTLSVHPKSNLGQDINKWRGTPFTKEELESFDITKLLGAWCRLDIVHNDSEDGTKTYANIEAIKYTTKKPAGVNPTSWWSVSEPDVDAFEDLPDWIKKKVEASEEWKKRRMDQDIVQVAKEKFPDGEEPVNIDDMGY
jgi:hypothetical protein